MITKDNFVIIAMGAYDNPTCKTIYEFEEDISKFQHLSRITSKNIGDSESKILLNIVMLLLNNFEPNTAIRLMFFKVKETNWVKLKSVLVFLNRMPHEIPELGVISEEIEICPLIMQHLNDL